MAKSTEKNKPAKTTELPSPVLVAIEKSGLDKKEAEEYVKAFFPHFTALAELKEQIAGIINTADPTEEQCAQAKEFRLTYVKNRTGSEKKKKELKDLSLRKGNFIQALYNVVLAESEPDEEALMKIEKHNELKEAARKENLRKSRALELSAYMEDVSSYPLGDISEEAYQGILNGQKALKEKQQRFEERQKEFTQYANMNEVLTTALMDMPDKEYKELLADAKAAFEEKERNEELERNKQKRINERIEHLSSRGFTFDPEKKEYRRDLQTSIYCSGMSIEKSVLENCSDVEWKGHCDTFEALLFNEKHFLQEKADKEAEAKQQRFITRKEELMSLGFEQAGEQFVIAGVKTVSETFVKEVEDWGDFIQRVNEAKELKKTKDKLAEQEKLKADAEKKAEEDAAKGDKLKMADLQADILALKTKYTFKSKKHNKIYTDVCSLFDKANDHIEKFK